MDAYENMDPATMVEMTTDTVKFHPADVAGIFDVDMTNTDFIVDRQAPIDSINRNYTFLLPIKLEETSSTIIETDFREDRYLKTGLNFMKYFETYKQKILLVLDLTILVKLT